MTVPSRASAGPPAVIYVIRHGEKPADPPTPKAAPAPPCDRFDVIWSFILQPGASPAKYVFSQIPQQLLAVDAATII